MNALAGGPEARNPAGRTRLRNAYPRKPIACGRSGLASHSARSMAANAANSCSRPGISAFLLQAETLGKVADERALALLRRPLQTEGEAPISQSAARLFCQHFTYE